MPQNINLFLDEFQYHEPPFSGRMIVETSVKVSIVMLVIVAVSFVALGAFYSFKNYLKKEYEVAIKRLEEVQLANPPKQLDTHLQKQEAYLRNIIKNRKVLLNYLGNRTEELALEAKQSYAMKLLSIATVIENQAWIDQVEFNAKQVALSGMTVDYAVLPTYATKLSASLAQEFKSFNLKVDKEKPVWRFRFNTDVEDFDNEQSQEEDDGASITVEKVLGRTQGK